MPRSPRHCGISSRAGPASSQAPKRAYESEVRDEQARRTRRAIVGAARDLFLAQGYAATTIDAIAQAAQVSRRTVFTSVGGKAVLLKLVLEWAIVGDDEPVALAERSGIQALRAESDPRRRLETWVRIVVDVATRVAPIVDVITAAADGDPVAREMLAVSEEQRMSGARAPADEHALDFRRALEDGEVVRRDLD